MSRIGRMPITIPSGVEVKIEPGNAVTVKGPKGTINRTLSGEIEIKRDGAVITLERPNEEKRIKMLHGLTRALLYNMVHGVTQGYSKELEINGVGYRAAKQGKQLVLTIGYSHSVIFEEEPNITYEVPAQNKIIVNGIDKQRVGQLAAVIRGSRPPEPYLGKGIKYAGEVIRRKSGKAGKK